MGGLQPRLALNPFAGAALAPEQHAHGDRAAVARARRPGAGAHAAQAAPSLAAHVALELMRRADEEARPLIDAVLDALGMLSGVASDAERALRPLAGLLADPVAWLRSAGSAPPTLIKIQALFDALRPLMAWAAPPAFADRHRRDPRGERRRQRCGFH